MRKPLSALVAILLLSLPAAGRARAEVVTIVAGKDNTLFESATGHLSSGAGNSLFAGRTLQAEGQALRRALLWFDVAGFVPAAATIDSADLTLTQTRGGSRDTVRIHRVLASWGEGTSNSGDAGTGAPATVGDATWLHRSWPDVPWTTPGGDFEPAATAGAVLASISPYRPLVFRSTPALTALVQAWLTAPDTNHGVTLRINEALASSAMRFWSREYGLDLVGDRPLLRVVYSVPVPATPTSWGRVKAGYR